MNIGWKTSISAFIASTLVVFGINLGVLIWAIARAQHVGDDGSFVLQSGTTTDECAKQKQLDTWAHLLINVLSTIILSGSNYCMQCLSAPTRSDIDKAHVNGSYLDIGVSSLRNLLPFTSVRAWLWLALGVTSLPLHLFYNSAMYSSTSSNNYAVFSVGSSFVQTGNPANTSAYYEIARKLKVADSWEPLGTSKDEIAKVATRLQATARQGMLINMSASACIQSYVQTFQSNYRSLILVTDNTTKTIDYVEARFYRNFPCSNRQAYSWACGYAQPSSHQSCLTECDQRDINNRIMDDAAAGLWSPLGNRVQYCLAEPAERQCQLQFNRPIAITVVALNLVKICLMLSVVFFAFPKKHNPILTCGDAANSFLTIPDSTTRFKCLISKKKVLAMKANLLSSSIDNIKFREAIWRPVAMRYLPVRQRWGSAVSGRRWFVSILLYVIAFSTAAGYLRTGINNLTGPKDFATLWRMGIGSVSNGSGGGKAIVFSQDQVTLHGAALLFKMVILANIPQLVLSLLYFTYNALLTIMLMSQEWSYFALRRKGLRVASTNPIGEQRGSYWLQLPFRWSVPLIIGSVALHWLVSQSIFLVDVNFTGYDGELLQDTNNNLGHLLSLGYSPIAIIWVIAVSVLLILSVMGIATLRRFASSMPIAANNSIAISAACHSISAAADVASRKLQWGDTGRWNSEDLAQSRSMLREMETSFEMSDLDFHAKSSGSIEYGSSASLIGGEYLLAATQNSQTLGHESDEDPQLTDADHWHCGFSSRPVETPVEGRLYA